MNNTKIGIVGAGIQGVCNALFLQKKNYEVHGVKRRSSSFNTSRIDHIYSDPQNKKNKFNFYARTCKKTT